MTRSRWLAGLAVVPVAAVMVGLWLNQLAPASDQHERKAAAQAGAAGEAGPGLNTETSTLAPAPRPEETDVPAHRTPASLGPEPFADSLRGTDIDGYLAADASGNLIIDTATRDFFDYFLNTVGEVSPEQALAQIEQLAHGYLPLAAARQALALLDDYLAYKREAVALGNRPLDPARARDPAYQLAMFERALADLKRLRTEVFSSQAHEAFFGLEEAYGDYTLANLALQQRDDLSAEARDTLMEWHRQQLPSAIRQTEQRLHREGEIQRRRQHAISTAASPEAAGEQLRELGLAEQQVSEVVAYLEQRAGFDEQFADYQADLQQLEDAGLAESDLTAQQDALLERHFHSEQSQTWARLRTLSDRTGP